MTDIEKRASDAMRRAIGEVGHVNMRNGFNAELATVCDAISALYRAVLGGDSDAVHARYRYFLEVVDRETSKLSLPPGALAKVVEAANDLAVLSPSR